MKKYTNRLSIILFLLLNMLVVSCECGDGTESGEDNKKGLQTKEGELMKKLQGMIPVKNKKNTIPKTWETLKSALDGLKSKASIQEIDEVIAVLKNVKAGGDQSLNVNGKDYLESFTNAIKPANPKIKNIMSDKDKKDEFLSTMIEILENFKQQKESK